MLTLRIALANVRRGKTRDESVVIATEAIMKAGKAGAAIVCFPECFLPGYRTPDDPGLAVDEAWLERSWSAISGAALKAHVVVILGTERIVDGEPRLTALVVNKDGTRAGWQDKVQLDPSEDNGYKPG